MFRFYNAKVDSWDGECEKISKYKIKEERKKLEKDWDDNYNYYSDDNIRIMIVNRKRNKKLQKLIENNNYFKTAFQLYSQIQDKTKKLDKDKYKLKNECNRLSFLLDNVADQLNKNSDVFSKILNKEELINIKNMLQTERVINNRLIKWLNSFPEEEKSISFNEQKIIDKLYKISGDRLNKTEVEKLKDELNRLRFNEKHLDEQISLLKKHPFNGILLLHINKLNKMKNSLESYLNNLNDMPFFNNFFTKNKISEIVSKNENILKDLRKIIEQNTLTDDENNLINLNFKQEQLKIPLQNNMK